MVIKELTSETKPAWSDVTSAGSFSVDGGSLFDRHYHDCDEYWLIWSGRARVVVGSHEYLVAPGDIVCIRRDTDHDVVEVYEPLRAFWFETVTPPGGRIGHLHRTPEDERGHIVPARPGPPPDFVDGAKARK